MNRVNKDVGAGLLFAAFGIFFFIYALLTLQPGTAFRMGPGMFPLLVGGLLGIFGIVIFLRGLRAQSDDWGIVPWRALTLIPASLIIFGLFARPLGLVPALLSLCFISAFASQRMKVRYAAILSVCMTVFCVLLFTILLDLSVPLWGDLLRF